MIDRAVAYALGVLCVGLAVTAGVLVMELRSAERTAQRALTTLATERADWAQERQKLTSAALVESEQARQTEAQWRAKHTEVQTNAQSQIRAASADAARARSAADSLQQRAEVIAAQCARTSDQQAPDPSFAPRGPAAADPGAVLTELLGRLAQTAGDLAAVADARGAAGAACENAYGALKGR